MFGCKSYPNFLAIYFQAHTADNLRKYGGFIPGIRPGESTALYIENILTKLTCKNKSYE